MGKHFDAYNIADHIHKLHLTPGDILIVNPQSGLDPEDIVAVDVGFPVPVIYAAEGDLRTMSPAQLRELIDEVVGRG